MNVDAARLVIAPAPSAGGEWALLRWAIATPRGPLPGDLIRLLDRLDRSPLRRPPSTGR